jgi:stress response protein YsnF
MAIHDNENNNHLQELGGSDFEIAEGQPDIRGWTVKDQQGRTVGEVDELIFDPQSLKVRYMVLDLEGNVLDLETRDVLIPIGLAQLDQNDDDVYLPNITADQLQSLPKYEKGIFDRDHEHSIRNIFAGVGGGALAGAAAPDANFYDHDYYNEDNLYRSRTETAQTDLTNTTDTTGSIPIIEEELNIGKRVVETGGARLRSRIIERPVEESVNLREEHIKVERNPVNRPATEADLAAFQEGEINITEHAEVPVINKEARVVEEISLEKEVEERDEVIRDTVRRTDVEIEDLDTDENRRRTDL